MKALSDTESLGHIYVVVVFFFKTTYAVILKYDDSLVSVASYVMVDHSSCFLVFLFTRKDSGGNNAV